MGRVWTLCLFALLAPVGSFAQSVDLSGPWKLSVVDDIRQSQPEIDDSGWPVIELPQRSPRAEHLFWLRKTVSALAGTGPAQITVGLVSESYEIYVNGVRIGDTGDFGKPEVGFFEPRAFPLPPGVVRPGLPVTIALRIWNTRTSWGSLTGGLRDSGPYWLTTPEHATAEIDAARMELRLALTPAWVVAAGQCGIALCLLLLWVAERERRELLYFAIYLVATGLGSVAGIWVVFTGGSSFWYMLGFRPLYDIAFLFLCLAATSFLRLPQIKWPVLALAGTLSAVLTYRTIYYLYPWLVLLAWQCGVALKKTPRNSLPFALPLLLYGVGILNNTLPANARPFPNVIAFAGMTLSVTNLIQLIFAAGMLVLILERLASDRRERQRLSAELDAARQIQQSLMPQSAPRIDGYSIGFRSSACYEVGGDYVDMFALPSGEQMMIVADVAGKGLAAALVSASFRSAFRAAAGDGSSSLPEVAARISQLHWNEGSESQRRFVTAIVLKLDPVHHRMEIVNAGHTSGFVVHSDGTVHAVTASGPPLGILPGIRYASETLDFPAGSRLLFYTDGITEVFRTDDEEFGPERLLGTFRQCSDHDCERILDSIWAALNEFGGRIHQSDDMTALVVCHM